MLKLENLNVHYGGIHALRGIDLEVPDKQIISLIGANGAGKSTTLKAIMGMVSKSQGQVTFNDRDITRIDVYKRQPLRLLLGGYFWRWEQSILPR